MFTRKEIKIVNYFLWLVVMVLLYVVNDQYATIKFLSDPWVVEHTQLQEQLNQCRISNLT